MLEEVYPAGGVSRVAGETVKQLLNVPYGYDYNTLSIILAAWCGFHRHDLVMSRNGQLQSITSLAKDLKPKEFLELVSELSIKRADADAVRSGVQLLLTRVDRGAFSQDEARDAVQVLEQAIDRDDIDQRSAIESTLAKIKKP